MTLLINNTNLILRTAQSPGNNPQPIKHRRTPQRIKGTNQGMEKFLGKLGDLSSGLQKHAQDAIHPNLKAADVQVLQTTMAQAYQAEQVAIKQYKASSQAMSQACKTCKQELASAGAQLRNCYGADSPELADFGVKPHQTRKKGKKAPVAAAPAPAQTPVLHEPAPAHAPRRVVKGGGTNSHESEYSRVASSLYQMEQGIEKHAKDPNFPTNWGRPNSRVTSRHLKRGPSEEDAGKHLFPDMPGMASRIASGSLAKIYGKPCRQCV